MKLSGAIDMKIPDKTTIMDNLRQTKNALQPYPVRLRFLEKYFQELEKRLSSDNSEIWMSCQNDRLSRIRWLMDKDDDGTDAGLRLKIRPYDIPWIIYGLAKLHTKEFRQEGQYNGWVENMDKLYACPEMELEFTDKFADFCCLCQDLLPDGCVRHPDFGDYGKIFPQPNQMNKQLRENCEWVLDHLGLQWNSVIDTRELFSRCVQKIPAPAAFPTFPEISKKNWDAYQSGIQVMKEWLIRYG